MRKNLYNRWLLEDRAGRAGVAGNADGPGGEEREPPPKEPFFIRFFKGAAFYAATAAVFLLLNFFVVRLGLVNGQSMQPTLYEHDVLVIWQLFYTPRQGDIVVTSKDNALGRSLTKRVIATGGQHVRIEEGLVLVDGAPLAESYLPNGRWGGREIDQTVPQGAVFLLGDNRDNSYDSRELGCFSVSDIMGEVVVRLFPFSEWQVF